MNTGKAQTALRKESIGQAVILWGLRRISAFSAFNGPFNAEVAKIRRGPQRKTKKISTFCASPAPTISHLLCLVLLCVCGSAYGQQPALTLESPRARLRLDGFFYETAAGRTVLPSFQAPIIRNRSWSGRAALADGTIVSLMVTPRNGNFVIRLRAEPAAGIVKWGLTIDSQSDEYKWRDAWNPDRVYQGGQTIVVRAELHQLPLFIRAGSGVEVGDLNVEWNESRAVAERKPDLKALDEELKLWFAKRSVALDR